MNKRQFLEAIKDYPDDAPIVVAGDSLIRPLIANGYYKEEQRGAGIFGISDDPEVVRLEL